MTTVLLTLLGSLVTSFIGSFLCFIIWVHFDFDSRWEERKYRRHAESLARAERKMQVDHLATLRDWHNDGYLS